MPQAAVWIFLLVSSFFATVHSFAVSMSLYWYYWWFDIFMHFWGGALVVLGVYALCSLKHIPLKPTSFLIFLTLFTIMFIWEVFEWKVGLFNPPTHIFDTSKDVFVGFSGGLLAYILGVRLRM